MPQAQAHLVDVSQRAPTGELDRVDLHCGAALNDLIFVAQGSHIQHEGLSGTNELIVHLGQNKVVKWTQFSFYLRECL